ncbi:AEC family transporter, partial [Kaarinaea lacus]
QLPSIVPTILLTLFIIPALVMVFAGFVGLDKELLPAVVLEAAMPSMVLGVVLCDRFNLDVGLYATTVSLTTLLSLVSLPLWFGWLT